MGAAARVLKMDYEPRPLQRQIHASLKKSNCLVCHRGFGKTILAINQVISSGLTAKKPGARFLYVAPLRNQAKSVAWEALLKYSEPFRAKDPNIAELRVTLVGGSTIELYGADNPDAMRGIHPHGVIFDEYGDMEPSAWTQVISPSLATHDGWVIFIGTPKGQNGFHDLYTQALADPAWYVGLFKASETGVFSADSLEKQKKNMTTEEYAQEFECSFSAPNVGSYYGELLAQADAEKRITRVPWEPKLLVTTAWDLGKRDSTAIWFVQQFRNEVRVIDYYENSGPGITHYAQIVKSKPYVYDHHIVPHDADVSEYSQDTGVTRVDTLRSLGVNVDEPLERKSIEDGIDAVKRLLPRCYFDAEKTTMKIPTSPSNQNRLRGLPSLRAYHREWLGKNGVWRDAPKHDWASDGADAFRTLAMGLKPIEEPTKPLKYPGSYVV